MKMTEAKALCLQFTPKKRGERVLCSHLLRDETFCELPSNMHCPVMDAIAAEKAAKEQPAPPPAEPAIDELPPAVPAEPTVPVLASTPLPEPVIDDGLALVVQELAQEPPAAPAVVLANFGKFDQAFSDAAHLTRWSYSRIETGLGCLRHYFLKYCAKAPETDTIKAFIMGRLFHEDRACVDDGKPLPVRVEVPKGLTDEDMAKINAVVHAYKQCKPLAGRIGQSEVGFNLLLPGDFPLIGYIDGISDDGLELHELKFAQDADGYSPFAISRQVSVYLAGFPQSKTVTVTVAKKSKARRAKEESLAEFQQRLLASTDSSTFESRTYPREKFQIAKELCELAAGAKLISEVMAQAQQDGPQYLPSCRSTMKCGPGQCPYSLFCQTSAGCDFTVGCDNPERCQVGGTCAAFRAVWGWR